jgi:hypothetical protein
MIGFSRNSYRHRDLRILFCRWHPHLHLLEHVGKWPVPASKIVNGYQDLISFGRLAAHETNTCISLTREVSGI